MAVCWVILRGQQMYTVIQVVHSLLYIVATCHFFSVVTWKHIIKYLQKCEGCTHFCEILINLEGSYSALSLLLHVSGLLSRVCVWRWVVSCWISCVRWRVVCRRTHRCRTRGDWRRTASSRSAWTDWETGFTSVASLWATSHPRRDRSDAHSPGLTRYI